MPSQHSRQKQPGTSFRLLVEYDGTRYNGWQKQGPAQSAAGVKTIAGAIGRVLLESDLRAVELKGAGRTDSGVHASGQVAHLHLEDPIKASDLHWILEKGLPYDIAVPQLELCPPAFHARRDAVSRTYLYQVSLRKSAFAKNCTWWPKLPLDLRLIEDIWPLFEGNRSMAAFADLEEGEDPNCQIYECATDRNGHLLLLRVAARFFLRKQVRRMVGALVHCAMGKADVGLLKEDLASPAPDSARNWADKTAPASGLFLESVEY